MGIRFRNLKKTFFKKKVLITGHTGFKGSWMLLLLSFLGAKVIGVSNQEVGSKSHFGLIKKNIRFKNYFVKIFQQWRGEKMLANDRSTWVANDAELIEAIKSLSSLNIKFEEGKK